MICRELITQLINKFTISLSAASIMDEHRRRSAEFEAADV